MGTVQLWTGRFEAAERTLRTGLAVSAAPGCEYPRLNVLGRLAMVEFLRGRLRRAAHLGQDEEAFAEENGLPVAHRTGAGHLVQAMVALGRSDRETARRHLEYGQKSVGTTHGPFVVTLVPLMRVWQCGRDPRRALEVLGRVPATVGGRPLPDWRAVWVALSAATFHLARRDPAAAAAELEAASQQGAELPVGRAAVLLAGGERARAAQLLDSVLARPATEATRVEAWVLVARIRLDEGDRGTARESLREALALARPEERRRPFMTAGPWVRDLLNSDRALAVAHHWLGPPPVEPDPGPVRREGERPVPVEDLTDRERTVLLCLARAMSNEDIAQDLFLSVNTVTTHIRGVHRKLGVARRNEAVRRARELGLVGSD